MGENFIEELLEQSRRERDEATTRQAFALERRRQWRASAPQWFRRLQHELRDLDAEFNAKAPASSTFSHMRAEEANSDTFRLLYGPQAIVIELDSESEHLNVTYGKRSLAYEMEHVQGRILVKRDGDYLEDGNEAAQLTESFFRDASKLAHGLPPTSCSSA